MLKLHIYYQFCGLSIYFHFTNWGSVMKWTEWSASRVRLTAFPPAKSNFHLLLTETRCFRGIFRMFLRLTSSHMCHPSCQNEPGNGRRPHQWQLLHRWGMGSYGQQPPASYRSQNYISHQSKQTAEILQITWTSGNRDRLNCGLAVMWKSYRNEHCWKFCCSIVCLWIQQWFKQL